MPFPSFDKKEDIPKGFEGEYEEKDGKWVAKSPDVTKLEETLAKVRTEKKEADRARKAAEDERADIERKLAAASSGDEKDRVTKALAKFDADAAALKEEYEKRLKAANDELRTLKLDDRIKAAALKAGVIPAKVDAVLKLTKESFDLADDRIVVKDAKGEATTATVDDFFSKTYRTQMPELYAGTKASGGGAGGTSVSTASGTGFDETLSPERRLALAHEAGAKE